VGVRFEETPLPGVMLVQNCPAEDERGAFTRLFATDAFASHGLAVSRQTSLSRTARQGTLRGLHFQRPPAAETKLVTCLAGRVFDVVADLRPASAGFRRWFGIELHADGPSLLIPPGCAHGFLTLTGAVAMLYHIDVDHDPTAATGVRWNDPALAIAWPFPPVLLGARDAAWPDLAG
jgi:dTDP-4-dehydrorhamnose 3,5-epimerase